MTDHNGTKREDPALTGAESVDVAFDAFEINCPKCGSVVHVPYGRMPCPACGQTVFYDPLTNRPV